MATHGYQTTVDGSCARVDADVNVLKSRQYWNNEAKQIMFGDAKGYKIGKFGSVSFSTTSIGQLDKKFVAKIYKQKKAKKIMREIKILENLRDCTNVINLLDVVKDPGSQSPVLIFEYVNTDFKVCSQPVFATFNEQFRLQQLYQQLSGHDTRFYIFEILKALDYCHSKGIMHRDIKPENVRIDHIKRQLRLIDWGLAEFH